ncbi:hypothetical protein HY498_00010 [Candidatus Woesearchaeota archaeon]|nr:hypothetical protein [Candidatus Woesearchaeota archaeon]
MKNRKINVGLIGCGNVGSNVAHFLLEKKENSKLENIILAGIAVKNTNSKNELQKSYINIFKA